MNIYLDYNASTPIDPSVAEAMRPYLSAHHGNPSSDHWAARPAKAAVERARRQVADLLGCGIGEIIFTSGGSESNNLAIKGSYFAAGQRGDHIITSAVEHPAVLEPCRFLERIGASLTILPVDGMGMVDPDEVRRAITPKTILISIMQANNEVGTIQPISAISRIARERDIPLHTDAAQAVGKIEARVTQLGVDMLSLAGHKLYAPKGVGALYVAGGTPLEPLIHGAGHEGGRRAGTENVLLTVGLGQACALAEERLPSHDIRSLRDAFHERLRDHFGPRVVLNGHPTQRLPNTLNLSFPGHLGPEIIARLKGVAVSAGAACHTGTTEISPVLQAMGIAPEVAAGSIRFSLGRETTPEEIEQVIAQLQRTLGRDQ